MEPTAYELSWVAGGFGIAGTLLGALVTYRLSIRLTEIQANHSIALSDRNSKSAACAKLRAAFATALGMIYIARHHGTHDRPNVANYLRDNLLTVAAAIEEFRPFVPEGERTAFQEAWEEYRQEAVQTDYKRAGSEAIRVAEAGEDVAAGAITEEKIHAVLSFART